MKKTVLSLLAMLALTGLVQAQQQLLNNGFESWDSLSTYSQPSNWYTLNELAQFGFPETVYLTEDAYSGDYALVLESKTTPNDVLAGVICTGPIIDEQFKPDFKHMKIAFAGNSPTALRCYYKAWPQAGDTCVVSVALTRWNTSQQKIDTVASASLLIGDTVDTYTLANIPFTYFSPLPPDSMFVIMSSSIDGFNPAEGSKLQVDDITLGYATGMDEETTRLSMNVYPNPVKEMLTIELDHNANATAGVFDQTGRKVLEAAVSGVNRNIDLSNLANGIYFLQLHDANGSLQHTRLMVQH